MKNGCYENYPAVSCMGGSPGELSEELVAQKKRKKGWGMNCDVGEAAEGLQNSCDVGKATEEFENEL